MKIIPYILAVGSTLGTWLIIRPYTGTPVYFPIIALIMSGGLYLLFAKLLENKDV